MIQPQYAQPYPQGTPSANAVNIQIFEPKAYASPQQAMQPNYTNQLYNYPQASLYGAPQSQYAPYPMAQPMYQPMAPTPMYQPMPQYPGYPMQQPQPYTPYAMPQYPGYQPMPQQVMQVPYEAPQVVSPEPQPMPAPVIEQPQTQPTAPIEQTIAQPQVQPTPAQQPQVATETQPQPVQPKEPTPAVQPGGIDVAGLVTGLQSTNPAVQEKTITEIANYSQGEPIQAQQVLNEQIMTNLASIVNSDISKLQGPTPEQTAIFEKAARGEQLTPQETQLAQQLSPQTAAAKNKIISMFTLAMLQKNQRDELDAYMASQGATNIKQLQMQDLIGFNEIQNAVQNDTNPEVRLAGIQAISYVARPEDIQAVQGILQNSLNDPEPLIQQAAQETLSKLGTTSTPEQTPTPVQVSAPAPAQQQTQQAEIKQMPQQAPAQTQQAA